MVKIRRRRLKDTDSARLGRRLHAFGWSLWGGGALGAASGVRLGSEAGGLGAVLLGGLLGAVAGTGGAYAITMLVSEGGGWITDALHNPSGSSTPRQPEYSYPASLAMRGRYDEAVAAYEGFILGDPTESAPYVQIARLLRDEARRPEDALHWFRRALRSAKLSLGQEALLVREVVEICRGRLGDPLRAAPDLARFAERHAGHPEGAWAREELEALRAANLGD